MARLLEEFPPVATEQWEAAISKDLKGADYEKRLVWQTDEGIAVKPYYRREDLPAGIDGIPGEFPYARGTRPTSDWRICEEIDASDPVAANHAAVEAATAGAEEIVFVNAHAADAEQLGAGLNVPYRVDAFAVDATQFRGATAVQEVAFSVAAGIDEIAKDTSRTITFRVAIGSSFFFQIAKLRALRMLWARVVESFGGSREAAKAVIYARTSHWNETIYDPYVNVLRSTTEAMSAAVGGCDSLTVGPHDECFRIPDATSRRLARNTQLILKKEALLDKVADPAGGSYFVEVLTESLAREAWKLVQNIEAEGGFAKASSFIAEELETSKAAKRTAVAARRRVLVGTNQYPNLNEHALPVLERVEPDRAAEAFEAIRLRTERFAAGGGRAPKILLAEIGDVKMRKARSGFALNLFGCAGFDVVVETFDSVEAIAAHPADAIVLCSSDNAYLRLASELIPKLRGVPVIIAGYPKDAVEPLKQAGVADFVHVRSNAVEVLTNWQDRLGVKG